MDKEIEGLQKYLPPQIYNVLQSYNPINEVRLHKNKNVVIVSDNRNIVTETICTAEGFNNIIDNFCTHSLHTHAETINNGYITADKYRIGVCGKLMNGNVYEITSVNIRVPHIIKNVSEYIMDFLHNRSSLLLYSPPAVGKTTVLRDLIIKLSATKRIAVIDSRNELYDSNTMTSPLLDVFSGYDKESAVEIATRTMSPEYIICDEIGSYNECNMILSVQNTGVPLIASAHAYDIDELLRRKNIKLLHNNMIFDYYIGIKRHGNIMDFTATKREDVM